MAVKRVFRYIAGTLDYKIVYGPASHPANFTTYSDSDYAGCPDTAKSTSGFVLLMGGGAVSWSSKLQTRVARSSTEAEYIAAESAGREMAFFRYVFEDMGYSVLQEFLLFSIVTILCYDLFHSSYSPHVLGGMWE
jgi:hypothetical protein